MYKIYIMYFDGFDSTYIGTTKNLKCRAKMHYYSCIRKDKENMKLYKFIMDNNLRKKMKFKVLDRVDTIDFKEAKLTERLYIDMVQPDLNKIRPHQTTKEYFEEHKEEIYFKRNIANLKKREEMRERSLNYYYANKQDRHNKHKEYMKTESFKKSVEKRCRKVTCTCGKIVSFNALKKHLTTSNHHDKLHNKINHAKSRLKYVNKNINVYI